MRRWKQTCVGQQIRVWTLKMLKIRKCDEDPLIVSGRHQVHVGKFSPTLSWIAKTRDPRLVTHPVLLLLSDVVWNKVARRAFLWRKSWSSGSPAKSFEHCHKGHISSVRVEGAATSSPGGGKGGASPSAGATSCASSGADSRSAQLSQTR